MHTDAFEEILTDLTNQLTTEVRKGAVYESSDSFENRVRKMLRESLRPHGIPVDPEGKQQGFPDVVAGQFGVEVKFTRHDTWRSVANSIAEGTRSESVRHIYVVYGKMGGKPEVRWQRYEECVMHVRTSHSLRFEVEIDAKESLFKKFGVAYQQFAAMPLEEKMKYVRNYVRGRLKKGERLWWLTDESGEEHTLPPQARLYMALSQEEKRRLRAEAALLCPAIVKPSRAKHKYDDAALYLLTYHGVLSLQARDLFSAGSVALRADQRRGGNYILRALRDIEAEMFEAAQYLEGALFEEYWGVNVPPGDRIREWLRRADALAKDWKPSEHLFLRRRRR